METINDTDFIVGGSTTQSFYGGTDTNTKPIVGRFLIDGTEVWVKIVKDTE
jgi:hypothetical protein